jgi:enoyl-CoA hydratase
MQYQNLLSELRDHILYVTINRTTKLNALNKRTIVELADVVEYASRTQEVRGVILTGSGEKAFVAGADISEFAEYNVREGEKLSRNGHTTVFNAIEQCGKPFIAAINGFALGGGLELAMACHMRVASTNARLGLPEVSLGLVPGYGGTQRLAQLVGKGRAIEMIATADMISAEKAFEIGLVNHVVPADQLIAKAEEILKKIKLRAPLAVAGAIRAVNALYQYDCDGFEVEISEFSKCFGTRDFKEGVDAFLNKRPANFRGE